MPHCVLACRFTARIAVLAGVACLAIACGQASDSASAKPLIYVSIPPQAEIVERIAGDRFEVRVLLGQGSSHETYEPRPSQIRDLAKAALYVRMGVPYEEASWDSIRGANEKMRVVFGLEEAERRTMTEKEGHAGDDHGHGAADPHLWLDPRNMKRQAEAVARALQDLDPEHAQEYADNLGQVQAELDQLDADLRRILEPVRGKAFWVYHPAWGYFADAYGLEQRAVEQHGKEIGIQSLARLVEEAREAGVRVIFVDPQFSSRNARVVAQEIGADIRELNPLAPDYTANLRRAAEAIAEALS